MTVTTKFTPPTQEDGDKVRVSPSSVVNTLLVIEVLEYVEAFKTRFSPEGKPAIKVNVASVVSGKSAPNQIWSNAAIVDSLRPYVGSTIICKIEHKTSGQSGYRYLTVVGVSPEEQAEGDKFVSENPDLFTMQQPATTAEAGHW